MLTEDQLESAIDAERKIAAAIAAVKSVCSSRETSLALTKLEEASLWLGKFKFDAIHDDVRRG
ncbi:MAG TPA: hypothetical protein VIW64_09355 [Pyrinomonadaceae bacterium]|jgi:hypothetical protein